MKTRWETCMYISSELYTAENKSPRTQHSSQKQIKHDSILRTLRTTPQTKHHEASCFRPAFRSSSCPCRRTRTPCISTTLCWYGQSWWTNFWPLPRTPRTARKWLISPRDSWQMVNIKSYTDNKMIRRTLDCLGLFVYKVRSLTPAATSAVYLAGLYFHCLNLPFICPSTGCRVI